MTGAQFNKSYFIGFDDAHGWGNTTYFSFFSEFNRPWIGLPYIEALILIFIFIITLLTNLLIFYQILHIKSTRTVTNYLMCNLAIADVLLSFGSPFVAVARISGTWILGSFTCKMLVYVMFICASVMIWTMTIVSIDRYICINRVKSKKMSPRLAVLIIVIVWIVDFLCFIPLAMYFNVKEFPFGHTSIRICTLMWPNFESFRFSVMFTTSLCMIAFVIPLIIIVINYYKILRKFWTSRRAVHSTVNRMTSLSSSRRMARDVRDYNVVKTLILVVVLFLVMWTPIFSVFVAIQLDGMDENMVISSQSLIGTLGLALCNAFINPFVYGVMNKRIKAAVLNCIACRNKRELSGSESMTIKAISNSQTSTNEQTWTYWTKNLLCHTVSLSVLTNLSGNV